MSLAVATSILGEQLSVGMAIIASDNANALSDVQNLNISFWWSVSGTRNLSENLGCKVIPRNCIKTQYIGFEKVCI